MEERFLETTRELIAFLDKSPTAFQAVGEIAAMLAENGFTHLSEAEEWSLVPGEKY
ncbi:MAG: M18 family aminopeptidase, partial [Eubacteriales bacterium]|nr:M18 family aminopeptidase [Eubacteriales bacterium]